MTALQDRKRGTGDGEPAAGGRAACRVRPQSIVVLSVCVLVPVRHSPLLAQLPPDLARERAAFSQWLATAPNSPLAAIALAPIGGGISIGSDGEVPLAGLPRHRLTESQGSVVLTGPEGRRTLPRGRLTPLGGYTMFVAGPAGRSTVTLFGPERARHDPSYFPFDSALVLAVTLARPDRPASRRILGPDGLEVEASDAGTVAVTMVGAATALHVYRIPGSSSDESSLMIYFRDQTNGNGSYPAGRFVELNAMPDGRYRLDFNRSQNPFCAYSTVYPCPAPWPGNALPAPVRAGERYEPK